MKIKKTVSAFIILISAAFLFAANDISLLENSKKSGVSIYWDSLSETGMLEKNDHHLSFRSGEGIVILDGVKMMITDAPELKENKLFVSKKFIDDSETFFSQSLLRHVFGRKSKK